jgi:hypothetical protein
MLFLFNLKIRRLALIEKSKIINHMFVHSKIEFSRRKHSFLENFESIKERIRCAPGNRLLELYQDKENKSIFFTYSYWDTEEDLENYRILSFSMKFGLLRKIIQRKT